MKNPRPAAMRTAKSIINTRDEDEIEEEAIDNDLFVFSSLEDLMLTTLYAHF
jgi:hypothetical protein